MLKAEKKNGTFVRLHGDDCVDQLMVWPENHFSRSKGPRVMDGLTVRATHPAADAGTRVPLGSQAVTLPESALP
jgi:hypothetical protein